ncbi:MAG: hypothetical protein ACLTDF_09905 [Coprococcus sp.]
MADSLVKHDDANKSGTVAVWQDILGDIHSEYPESAFVSEWGKAEQSIKAGFDMDFYLDWMGNGYNSLVRDYEAHLNAFASLPRSSMTAWQTTASSRLTAREPATTSLMNIWEDMSR